MKNIYHTYRDTVYIDTVNNSFKIICPYDPEELFSIFTMELYNGRDYASMVNKFITHGMLLYKQTYTLTWVLQSHYLVYTKGAQIT